MDATFNTEEDLADYNEYTTKVLDDVRSEIDRQAEIGTRGVLAATNDLLATAMAYLGRAAEGVRRNEDDSEEMVMKGISVLVDLAARLKAEKNETLLNG